MKEKRRIKKLSRGSLYQKKEGGPPKKKQMGIIEMSHMCVAMDILL